MLLTELSIITVTPVIHTNNTKLLCIWTLAYTLLLFFHFGPQMVEK